MKIMALRRISLSLTCATALMAFGQFSTAFAQGGIAPTNAPGPMFKTLLQLDQHLDQMSQQATNFHQQATNRLQQLENASERRYPIYTFQTNLTVSGSYYLTTNLFSGANNNDAINIRTNVTDIIIDLNGFSLISTNPAGGASPVGVRVSAATNIVIRNGQITGFDRAIRSEGSQGIIIENIYTHNSRRAGIEVDGNPGSPWLTTVTIRNCVVEGVDGTGEGGSVSCDGIVILNCVAMVDNCTVRDITAVGTGSSSCINAQGNTNTFVNNCFLSNADTGLKMSGGGTNRLYYRNNLTSGCGTPFSGLVGTDRGGNF
jgi:hypothetical protein